MQKLLPLIPLVLLAATSAALGLAGYFWRHRRQPGAVWFGACVLSCGVWTFLDALSFLLRDPPLQDWVRRAAWVCVLSASLCFFRFACRYAQRTRWWRMIRAPLLGAM